jgi:hypothetical protein
MKHDKNFFTEKNLRTKSLGTLYRWKRIEKSTEGTLYWYFWPANIRTILNKLIKEKLTKN